MGPEFKPLESIKSDLFLRFIEQSAQVDIEAMQKGNTIAYPFQFNQTSGIPYFINLKFFRNGAFSNKSEYGLFIALIT